MMSRNETSLRLRTALPRAGEALAQWVGALSERTGSRPASLPHPLQCSRRPQIICVPGSKGGPGKTTLAANLGAAWAATSANIVMIDADVRQQSLFTWGSQRRKRFGEAAHPVVVSASERQLAYQIRQARQLGWAVTIVDLPGGDTALNTLILGSADLVLVATRATALDIQAACRMGRQLKDLGVNHRFVLTQTPPGLARVARAREVLNRYAPVLATSMGSRVVYQDAIACGAGVTQLKRPDPAVEEIRALLKEVLHLPELRRGCP